MPGGSGENQVEDRGGTRIPVLEGGTHDTDVLERSKLPLGDLGELAADFDAGEPVSTPSQGNGRLSGGTAHFQ